MRGRGAWACAFLGSLGCSSAGSSQGAASPSDGGAADVAVIDVTASDAPAGDAADSGVNDADAASLRDAAEEPPPPLVDSGPIVIDGQNDAGVVGVHVTSTTGDCIRINGSSHVTIRGSEIGPCAGNGIVVTGSSSDVVIADSYVHPEHPTSGCCDTGDGVFVNGATSVTLQGNVIAWGETNIEANTVTGLTVVGNFLLNPQNSGSRGQNFQVWGNATGFLRIAAASS